MPKRHKSPHKSPRIASQRQKDKAPRVAYVEWDDSSTTRGWGRFDKASDRPMRIKSVGFVVHSDQDQVTLSTSYDDQEAEKCIDPISIPRSAIRKVREIPLLRRKT